MLRDTTMETTEINGRVGKPESTLRLVTLQTAIRFTSVLKVSLIVCLVFTSVRAEADLLKHDLAAHVVRNSASEASGLTHFRSALVTALDAAPQDKFGNSIAISGNTAIIGSRFDDVGANADQGSAYVFVRSGSTWTQQAKLTAADGQSSDAFGTSVAISGNIAVVGAPGDDAGANLNEGSVYIFVRSGVTWTQQTKLTAS